MASYRFDDHGHQCGVQEFDYDAVESAVDPKTQSVRTVPADDWDELVRQDRLATAELLRWIFQCGSNDPRGVLIRCKVVAWNCVAEIQSEYSLTQLAGESGASKQSFGRWQDRFKTQFPFIVNIHNRR